MDLTSRLRSIVRSGPPRRELTYEPDTGAYEAAMDIVRVGEILGGVPVETAFGRCLVIDRRYESDRYHGDIRIGDCDVRESEHLHVLDPDLSLGSSGQRSEERGERTAESGPSTGSGPARATSRGGDRRTIFIDLETTGLSGGAGTVAFLVGCGYFDLGAFQVRQFLLTSYASERALLAAVAEFFDGTDLLVSYNGKTFDVPVMETRWMFHRIPMPLDAVPHFDMLHPARRLWKARAGAGDEGACCRLGTLERTLFDVARVGDVPGLEIPSRYFRFLRTGDPRPLEPVLEHNRLDLVSLAAVMAHAMRLAREGHTSCRDASEALSLGKVYERAGLDDRAEACYRHAADTHDVEVRGEALYRLGLRLRRDRRFPEAAAVWRDILAFTEHATVRRRLTGLRHFATEALAIHQEHRARDFAAARELALFALDEVDDDAADALRHRLARLDRKLAKKRDAQLFS